eukprot:symbB.v1.2.035959.t1/scaffold4965.1/size32343/4
MQRSQGCVIIAVLTIWAASPVLVWPRIGCGPVPRRCSRSEIATGQWWWKGGPGEESEEEITVFVPIGDDIQAKDVAVDIRCSHLSVRVKDQMPLDGDLWKDIKADESGWLIDQEANQRCIIITLIKCDVWIVACLHLCTEDGPFGRPDDVLSSQMMLLGDEAAHTTEVL